MSSWNPRANDLFLKALEFPSPEARERFLADACAGDTSLRADVDSLLSASARAGSFLQAPASEPGGTAYEPGGDRHGAVIGSYKLLQQIGEGGMGTVYMAEQTHPVRRKVALKLIKPGMDSSRIIARFDAERQALALMDHPNIARVLDAGATDGGRPFFVMELVKGVPITNYCDEHHLTPRQRLELFLPVCHAIQHAHQKGVIHRDIKPSNVMVCTYDGKPVPKVIDFGVAKAAGPQLTERTLYTEFGAIVGTFEYMSPEQANLDQLDIDTRCDIYSLGVLLYELLTGTTPLGRKRLKEVAVLELLRLVREEEAPRPSTRLSSTEELPSIAANRSTEPKKLTGLVRGELDWIVMKALEKDRNRRYETANGLAQDIERYLNDESVRACPPSAAYRFRKFARRNRAALAAVAAVAVALLAGTAAATWQAIRATRAEGLAQVRLEAADANALEAENQRVAAATQASRADEQRRIAVANEKLAKDQEWLARRRFYAAQMNLATQAWQAGQVPRVLELLEGQRPKAGEPDLRGFEWYYLWRLCNSGRHVFLHGHTYAVLSVAFSPDGKTLASASWDGTVRLWDPSTGKERHTFLSHNRMVWDVAFSPDGKTMVSGGAETGSLILWDASTATPRHVIRESADQPVFSPDGRTLAAYASNGVKLWDVATGAVRAAFAADKGIVVGFVREGQTLVTIGRLFAPNSEIRFLDAATGAPRSKIPLPGACAAALSRDGAKLAVSAFGTSKPVTIWDTATGKRLAALPGQAVVRRLSFSADGSRLAGAAEDRTVSVWEVETGRRIAQDVHLDPVWGVAFSPDGKTLASSTLAGAIKLWDMAPAEEAITVHHRGGITALRFDPERKALVLGGSGPAKMIDAASGREIGRLPLVGVVAASADANTLVASDGDDGKKIWDVRAGREVATLPLRHTAPSPSHGPSVSPDGKTIATFHSWGKDNTVNLWDVATRKMRTLTVPAPVSNRNSVLCATFSPDGKLLAAGYQFQWVTVWDVATGVVKLQLFQRPDMMNVRAVAFSPDAKTLAVGTDTGTVTLWDVETGRRLAALSGHTQHVLTLAFSPDGATLATAGADKTVRLWDVATGQERSTLRGHAATVVCVEFAPDGNTLATAGEDGAVKLWRAATDEAARSRKRELDPDPENHSLFGHAHAESGEWQRAAEHFEKLTISSPTNPWDWYNLALLKLRHGQEGEYRRVCTKMLGQIAQPASADAAFLVVWTCVLGPDAAADWTELLRFAESAHAADRNNFDRITTLGAALYRAGRFAEASRRLTEADDAFRQNPNARTTIAYNWLFQAMAQHRLGRTAEAAGWLDKAVQEISKRPPTAAQDLAPPSWNRRLTTESLCREAQELLGRKK